VVLASVPAAEGVGWPDALPLLPHPAELIVGLIAFAILYWIYATKVVPKMEAMYDERAAAIEGGMQQAEEAQAEAKAALDKYNEQLAGARTEHRATWDTPRGLLVLTDPAVTVYGRFFQIVQLTLSLPHRGPTTPVR
jgi:hypothetical protein